MSKILELAPRFSFCLTKSKLIEILETIWCWRVDLIRFITRKTDSSHSSIPPSVIILRIVSSLNTEFCEKTSYVLFRLHMIRRRGEKPMVRAAQFVHNSFREYVLNKDILKLERIEKKRFSTWHHSLVDDDGL